MKTRHAVLTAATGLTLTLSACGESGESDGGSGGYGAESPSASPTSSAPAADDAASRVRLGTVGGDQVLTDGKGVALYLFTKDKGSTSTCVDDCLEAWPPVAGPATAGKGVAEDKLGVTTRPDGSKQATYAGKPLYRFAEDKASGDGKGQGLKGVWYLLDAGGQAVKK